MAYDGFTCSRNQKRGLEMSLHFRFTESPLHEHQVRTPRRRAVARCIGKDVRGVRVTVHAFEGGRTFVNGHIAAQCALIARVMVGGEVVAMMLGQRENVSFTMLPAINAMLAGRSASRRIR